jgi:hypothetical protein
LSFPEAHCGEKSNIIICGTAAILTLYPAFVVMTIWRYPATYLYISTATAEILVVILIAKIQMARTYVPQLAARQ